MYYKAGLLEEARKLFDRMPERNYDSWDTMISRYATQRMVVEALGIFESTHREEFARMALRLICMHIDDARKGFEFDYWQVADRRVASSSYSNASDNVLHKFKACVLKYFCDLGIN
ncbi:hypothetical protein LWI29_009077 [Acer saccharum]|uniref:Pentatricopeptide repeat-containing protein n=1 Tax=Acer saccharum TaxID=4024 RepID=A0AA39S7I4_ACESA|nr:hypothetical protein LWI29_009077 [Acer saccharum]